MDLVEDFAVARKRKREVLNISGTYNDLNDDSRLYGKTEEILIRTARLRSQILEFAHSILDEHRMHKNERERKSIENETRLKAENIRIQEDQNIEISGQTELELAKKEFIRKRKQNSLATDVVVDAKGIAKTLRSGPLSFVLNSIDIRLRLRQITAVVGENASGKTTLLEILAGRLKHDLGELSYPCLRTDQSIDLYSVKQQIAYIPQRFPGWPGPLIDSLHFSAAIHGVKGEKNAEEVDFIISRLGLEKYKRASWSTISSGYKTRFSLAKVLVWHPKLLVLDEPLANLDINSQLHFLQDLRNLVNSVANPMSVVLSSQHLYEIENIADNIIFLKEGKALYNGSIAAFGGDRKENSFELGCNLSLTELRDILAVTNYRRIESSGNNFTVHAPTNLTANELLTILVEGKVELKYFRDISRSTRKLFEIES